MTAATVMGELRSALRAYLSITHDPARVLGLLSDHTIGQSWEQLATASVAVIDSVEGTLDIASAGHPSPLLAGEGYPAAPLTLRFGLLLGAASAQYHLERVTLPQAGSLVFFTDGLIDEGRIDAESRLQSLAALMDRQWAGDLEALADGILNSLSHADSGGDDRALLLARWSL